MYIPEHFKENNQQSLFDAIKEMQTAHVVTQHADGTDASFLPLYLDEHQGENGILYGHIAKANAQWKAPLINPETLAIFTGAYHYITPSWYPAKQTHHKVVPTLNYIIIHVRGVIEFIQDTQELLSIVTKLTNIKEHNFQIPWKVEDAPSEYIQAMLKAIIGVKITITDIQGKYKLSQNQNSDTQQSVIHGLQDMQDNNGTEIAKLIQDHLNKNK